MTEAYEDDFLVRVRAQVMARDDHTGGWVPLAGGGLANVSVRKTTKSPPPLTPTNGAAHPQHEYRIYGKRIADQSVVLSCTIKKDFEYNKVMPTFHHWRTGQQRFGLTFQTAADARAFDKGVRIAVEELLYGLAGSCALTTLQKYNKQVGDDDVFMTLNLPLEPTQSRSSSEGSGSQDLNKKIHIISMKDKPDPLQLNTEQNENYSYVQLTAMHEYTYPVVEQNLGGGKDSSYSLKKRLAPDIPPSPPVKSNRKLTKSMRQRCRHCQELYFEEMNQRGDCEYAPDWFKSGIETITGIRCARCMLYHCMSDSEGEFSTHPCDCSNRDDGCGKKWIGLALLSLLVPCLLCYPPLKACHWLGMGCGLCGGRHGPTS